MAAGTNKRHAAWNFMDNPFFELNQSIPGVLPCHLFTISIGHLNGHIRCFVIAMARPSA